MVILVEWKKCWRGNIRGSELEGKEAVVSISLLETQILDTLIVIDEDKYMEVKIIF